ncbi:MAG TPA: O-antigen ligase family protein [Bacteroidota bacterium]|jgi:hypothetical protein|nr:O-antigen ligase family protein [Bacteroidota bacterium]
MGSDWTYAGEYPDDRRTGRNLLTIILVSIFTIGISFVLLATYGNILASGACLMAGIILVLSCYRLEWGFYFFIGMVLLFDQYAIPGFDSVTYGVLYFRNLKEISYLPANLPQAVVNPLELQLLLLVVIWFVVSCFKKDLRIVRVPMWGAAAIFFLGLLAAFAYGLRRGGDLLPALWEVRALFYMGILYVLVPQIIRTKSQMHALISVCIVAITFKAFQGIARFASLGFSFDGLPTLTNHEDPVFMLDLIILLFGFVLFGARTKQRTILLWLLLPLLMGFYAGQRRATYAALVPALIVFVAVIPRKQQKIFLKTLVPVVAVVALYCTIFWNSESKLASPVRLVKTGFGIDPETTGDRYYSNLYREIEKLDLAKSIQDYPLLGVGFGNKYEMPLPLVKIDFPLRDYIPHNEILWVLVKMGAFGFCLFCFFFNAFACQAASTLAKLNDPYFKAVCAMAVAAVINQLVVSYYDLQLTFYRNMVFLGTFMGLVAACMILDQRQAKPASEIQVSE